LYLAERFIPVEAPVHSRPLSRIEIALAARRNALEIIPALAYRQPIVSGETLVRWHMVADPAALRRVLLDNQQNYPKSEIMRRMLRPAIGESLFNAEGPRWKWQRQAVAPIFTHRNVIALAHAMSATATRACERLAACGGRAELVDEMLTATFDVICDVALSGRKHFDGRAFGAAVTRYFKSAGRPSLLDFFGLPAWVPRPGEWLVGSSVRTMHRMVAQAIESRRGHSTGLGDDLLDRMLAAEDPETGRRMTPEDLVHNMQFFIVAGHETTALAIAWSLYLLANVPEYQDKARAQVVAQLRGRVAEADDLDAMPFIRQVLEEAMRLYPPVGLVARTVLENDVLCGRNMRPNDTIFLPIWALHRHEMLWDAPRIFNPDRFSEAANGERDRYQYLPFGAGPRVCVGANFAMMQAQIIFASLLQRFRFTPSTPAPRPTMTMTVRPEPGVFLLVEPLH
jgi:cytochrome P450